MRFSLVGLFHKFFPQVGEYLECRRQARAAERAARRQLLCVRPQLQVLEDRTLLSAYMFGTVPVGGAANPTPSTGAWTNSALWSVWNPTLSLWVPTNNGATPGSGDTAEIPNGAVCTLSSSGTNQTVAGLTVDSGGTLTVDSQLSATTTNTYGEFDVTANGQFYSLGSTDFGGTGTVMGQIDATGNVVFDPTSAMTLATGAKLTGGGTFDVLGPLDVTGALTQSAPIMMDANGNTTLGSITGTGSIEDWGDFSWYGGTLGLIGGFTIEPNAAFKTEGADGKTLSAGTLTNDCTGTDLGGTGSLYLAGGSEFYNFAGTTDVELPLIGNSPNGGGSLLNGGSATLDIKAPASTPTVISVPFTNEQTLATDGGTLTLMDTAPGQAADSLGGNLNLGDDVTLVGSYTGAFNASGIGHLKVGGSGGSGVLTLSSGTTNLLGGALEVTGSGTLNGGGQLYNNGTLQLDVGAAEGLGSYQQGSSGVLDVHTTMSGRRFTPLKTTGSAQLSGTLKLDFDDGYQPQVGDSWTVVQAGSVGAHFDTLPDSMQQTVTATTDTVTKIQTPGG